jgi:hypothetical protein
MLNLKKIWSKLFSCRHSWVHPHYFANGEDHGIDWLRRYCEKCGKKEFRVYYEYGDYRYTWTSYSELGIDDEQ